ncbi:hypothetical protein CCACVL1_22466 [Corchorus capsularis]|uniref:Uncharacterized protein n=2 Tax=Corchorus TaxID=93758 RepID=A0A1R3GYG8_COCAP|nr:hypothetical protein CCACVL1_22466 [Corchorus capsularis]OMO70231.1 hypothetical protein COLO4_28681 [Corchorus olitorius]
MSSLSNGRKNGSKRKSAAEAATFLISPQQKG